MTDETPAQETTIRDAERTAVPADVDAHDRIAERAYQRFEARGGQHGYDVDDWLAAEQELAATAGNLD